MKLKRALEIMEKGGFLYPNVRRDLEARLEQYNEAVKDREAIEYVLRLDEERKKSLTKPK